MTHLRINLKIISVNLVSGLLRKLVTLNGNCTCIP